MRQDLLATSVPVMDIKITIQMGDIPMAGNDVPILAESADPGIQLKLYMGCLSIIYYGGDLAHHYRVFKRGLPHLAFRKDYLACLRVFVSQATALAQCDMASPVPPSSFSARHARSSEVESESPRKTRCARRRMWPTRVCDESVGVESPTLTVQDIPDRNVLVHRSRTVRRK